MKKFLWKGCSNLAFPTYPSILEVKHKMIKQTYKGRGRPRLSDYEYKSIMDVIFEINEIHNRTLDNIYFRKI